MPYFLRSHQIREILGLLTLKVMENIGGNTFLLMIENIIVDNMIIKYLDISRRVLKIMLERGVDMNIFQGRLVGFISFTNSFLSICYRGFFLLIYHGGFSACYAHTYISYNVQVDLIGMMDDGNGMILLVVMVVIAALFPTSPIVYHHLLC